MAICTVDATASIVIARPKCTELLPFFRWCAVQPANESVVISTDKLLHLNVHYTAGPEHALHQVD